MVPKVRFVMQRSVEQNYFVFYSSYISRKAQELAENRWGSLAVYKC